MTGNGSRPGLVERNWRFAKVLTGGAVALCLGLSVGTAGADVAGEVSRGAEARGIVKARHEATISSELVARVVRLPFRAGEDFRAGDVLIGFDCARYDAELEAAKAETRAAVQTYEANLELNTHRAVGATELAISEARADQARANVRAFEVRATQCSIKAPFDGRMVELFIHEHEMPAASTPLFRVVGVRDLEVEVLVPSAWLGWLRKGQSFGFTVDETETRIDAVLVRVGAVVDPVSQTAKIVGSFAGEDDSVRPGMSGMAVFEPPNG